MADLPSVNVVLNLDSLEREKTFEPCVFIVDGKEVTMKDAAELPWQTLMALNTPADFFRECMDEDSKEIVRKALIPGWKLNKMFEAWAKHYGVDLPGNGRGSLTF
jgi:hypothetical protein